MDMPDAESFAQEVADLYAQSDAECLVAEMSMASGNVSMNGRVELSQGVWHYWVSDPAGIQPEQALHYHRELMTWGGSGPLEPGGGPQVADNLASALIGPSGMVSSFTFETEPRVLSVDYTTKPYRYSWMAKEEDARLLLSSTVTKAGGLFTKATSERWTMTFRDGRIAEETFESQRGADRQSLRTSYSDWRPCPEKGAE